MVPAPEGVRTDYAIAQALAERLGLAEHLTKTPPGAPFCAKSQTGRIARGDP